MSNKDQKTLIETIRVNLERNEKGEIDFIPDVNGTWNIVSLSRTTSGLIDYFKPAYVIGVDKYGNPNTKNKTND